MFCTTEDTTLPVVIVSLVSVLLIIAGKVQANLQSIIIYSRLTLNCITRTKTCLYLVQLHICEFILHELGTSVKVYVLTTRIRDTPHYDINWLIYISPKWKWSNGRCITHTETFIGDLSECSVLDSVMLRLGTRMQSLYCPLQSIQTAPGDEIFYPMPRVCCRSV